MCPFCGSLPRNRRLWLLLKKRGDLSGHVLHFSPSRSLYRQLKREMGIRYFSSDFEGEFLADHAFDITVIDQPPDKFDLIICYHVLEHIPDDKLAMSELYRVLKPGGRIYIQTPFHNGEIYEDPTITSPAARELHFGQADHVRIYSVTGLEQRLANAGFKVEVLQFGHDETDAYFGLSSGETLLIARK